MTELSRFRGDTVPDEFIVDEPITGLSFLLTISTEENPSDTNEQLVQMVGEIVNSITGVVHFRPTLAESNALEPGDRFFDFQVVSPRVSGDPDVRTLDKGPYEIKQDITKD